MIGEDRFDDALLQVLEKSPFRPDISDIRAAAGIVEPELRAEREAKTAFAEVFVALRKHGPKLRPIIGEILNDGRDENGRIMPIHLAKRAPGVPAPTFSAATEAAILALGYGDRLAGLEILSRHPSLPWNMPKTAPDSSENSFRNHLAKDIEAQWKTAYLKQKS